jgi:hypothetical protein
VVQEGITENVGQIVPDLLAVEGVGKVGLGASIVQAILDRGKFDGDAA